MNVFIENNELYNGDSESASPNDASLDYEQLYDTFYNAFYDALDDYYSDNPIVVNSEFNDSSLEFASYNDALEFATSTDSKLYTVTVAGDGATSSPQQATAYMLEIRNLLLIFMLTWLCVILYSKIKNLIINYTTKN